MANFMRACGRKYRKSRSRMSWKTFIKKKCKGKLGSSRRRTRRAPPKPKRRRKRPVFIGPLTMQQAYRLEQVKAKAAAAAERRMRRRPI